MKNYLVVKDNALINASYNLEVTEQRLILLSIINARQTGNGITADSRLEISAHDYAKQFNVTREAAYEALKNAVNNLFGRQFSYTDSYKDTNKVIYVKSRWVSRIAYVEELAILQITFASDVVPLITKLEKHFTTYQLKQVSQLTSKYAIRLYELLISWRDIGKTPVIKINDFRFKLGVSENEYQRMHHLKERVLEPALHQINEHTDIVASYEQFKAGRTISGFQFTFKKKEVVVNTQSSPINLTEKQIVFFANKLAYDDAFASQYAQVGEEYHEVEKRLLIDLKNKDFIEKYSDDLTRVGFKIQKQ